MDGDYFFDFFAAFFATFFAGLRAAFFAVDFFAAFFFAAGFLAAAFTVFALDAAFMVCSSVVVLWLLWCCPVKQRSPQMPVAPMARPLMPASQRRAKKNLRVADSVEFLRVARTDGRDAMIASFESPSRSRFFPPILRHMAVTLEKS
jgi:hypothetical protein